MRITTGCTAWHGALLQASMTRSTWCDPSHFGVGVEFNAAGARKMSQATANHVGRPMAVLIDGVVITAPVLRTRISTSAVIGGDYTQAEAERIVNGISIR